MWRFFLQNYNSKPITHRIDWSTQADFKFFSDASGSGYAAVLGAKWIQGRFPESWIPKSIAIKELVPIYLAYRLWSSELQHSKILFFVDNMSVKWALHNHTSHDKIMMKMIRVMIKLSVKHDIIFDSQHIPGRHNLIADALSRFQVQKALTWAPWLHKDPSTLPHSWLPWSRDRRT